jgi:hypothetical protein
MKARKIFFPHHAESATLQVASTRLLLMRKYDMGLKLPPDYEA